MCSLNLVCLYKVQWDWLAILSTKRKFCEWVCQKAITSNDRGWNNKFKETQNKRVFDVNVVVIVIKYKCVCVRAGVRARARVCVCVFGFVFVVFGFVCWFFWVFLTHLKIFDIGCLLLILIHKTFYWYVLFFV